MKKLFTICTALLGIMLGVCCTPPEQGTENPPVNNTQPEITLQEEGVSANSFTFSITTTIAGELGYDVVAEGGTTPTIDEILSRNKTEVKDKATITIDNLNDNTKYTLFAVLRGSNGGILSKPAKLTFTTPDDGEESPIVINEVGYDSANFTINLPGTILFQCIDKATLEYYNQTVEDYITTAGIGIRENGPLTIDWVDGGSYGPIQMRMREDSEYYVIAAKCDNASPYPNITSEIYSKAFKTLRKPVSEAGITTELKNIASTEVTISTKPDSTVEQYYVYVRDKAWADGIISGYGEAMLATLVKNPNAGAWSLTSANEATWGGLQPETAYYCHILVIDNKGAEALTLIDFTTTAKTLAAPEIALSITEPATNAHSTLNLNIYSEGAASAKIVFRPTADVVQRRGLGLDDQQLVNTYGTEISADDVAAIASTGLTIVKEDLWPEVEYTAIVSIKNAEKTETIKATTHTTPKQAAAPRVESELFTSLLGEWEMTYSLVQENGVKATVSDVVTIAQGVDDKTKADYRDQNQLVILGFPFNVNAQGIYEKLPVYLPSDLLDEANGAPDYYKHGMNLVYRDYGAKVFLQIGEGDVITMPTSKGMYLYNWAAEGYLNFFGCDYENQWTAPATFPVTLSADGNTLTIGACKDVPEFGYGTYRPSVFLNDYQLKACATSDIILKRK